MLIRGAFKSSASGLPMLSSSMYGLLLCSRASETPTSSSIAAAKFECWKTSSRITSGAKIIKGVRIKRDPRWQGPRGTGEMVKSPPERRATYCGLYFGRGLNNYSIFPQIPSGQRCRACFRTRPQTAGSSSSSSSESSSPCA